MEHFMVGHELSHLAIAQLTDEVARPMEDTPLLQNAQFMNYREEHECDWLGHILATHALAEVYGKLPLAAWFTFAQLAGPIFLGCLQLTQRASHQVRTGTDLPERVPVFEEGSTAPKDTATHPPTEIRKRYLVWRLHKRTPSEARQTMEQVLHVGEWLDDYLESCWNEMRNLFLRTHGNLRMWTKPT